MSVITDTYEALGGEAVYGPPIDEEMPTPDGRGLTRRFRGATFFSTEATGTHEVQGLILARYLELGGPAYLGYPTTDETVGRDGGGRVSRFEAGLIAWSPTTGAWEVYGAIGALWESQGGEGGALGYPLTGEQAHENGIGRTQWFVGGQLYWSEATGAVVLTAPATPADLVNAFAANPAGTPWHGLDRSAVAARLGQLVADPDLVRQGNLNLCGPAVFVRNWIRRDPAAFVTFAAELYDTGRSTIGADYKVAPDDDACLATDYAQLQARYGANLADAADWMVMSALRDAENAFFDYDGTPDEDASALTLPGEVVEWLAESGRFSNIRDETNVYVTKGVDHARTLTPSLDQPVLVLLNTAMLQGDDYAKDGPVLNEFPNHWVQLEGPVVDVYGGLQLSYWCYGRPSPYRTIVVAPETFETYYYGAVIAG